ncbi:MAG: D-arabinono-1,4-lactone oxidase [Actinomycetota bacterium]
MSIFTRWDDVAEQVWVKQRRGAGREIADVLASARHADQQVHPVPGNDPSACTEQLGRSGSWADRLPHFRFDAVPNAGHELQSEYFVPRDAGPAAIAALRAIGAELRPTLMTSELRTVAADALWLSPFADRDSLALHFTWQPDPRSVAAAAARIEEALRPFEPRPHWGKVFTPGASAAFPTPRRAEAIELIEALDPAGVFANGWVRAEGLRSR